jgi:hypothetical protein
MRDNYFTDKGVRDQKHLKTTGLEQKLRMHRIKPPFFHTSWHGAQLSIRTILLLCRYKFRLFLLLFLRRSIKIVTTISKLISCNIDYFPSADYSMLSAEIRAGLLLKVACYLRKRT